MKKYLFVINPASGGTDKEQLIRQIDENCMRLGADHHIYKTTGTNDIGQVDQLLQTHKPEKCVISGGDGTINLFAPLILRYQLPLGIIPSGSANGLAYDLGITMDNALDVVFEDKTTSLNVTRINSHLMLHMADAGMNASLVKRYQAENRRGVIGYAISALQELPVLREPFLATVEADGKRKTYETKFLVIANTQTYGTGFEVNPTGRLADHRVELCILKDLSTSLIFESLFQNPGAQQPGLFDVVPVSEATITLNSKVDFQTDGEYIGEVTNLHISVLSDTLKVLSYL